MIKHLVGMAALAASLAACGTNPAERTSGGAAAGAATGAVIGAVGGPVGVLAGAAIGAGAGAVTGATTSPSDLNLGRPPWRNPEVRTPADRNRRQVQSSQRGRERATPEGDRAYMGGGMVGYPTGTTMNPSAGSNAPMVGSGRPSGAAIAPGMTPGMNPQLGSGRSDNSAGGTTGGAAIAPGVMPGMSPELGTGSRTGGVVGSGGNIAPGAMPGMTPEISGVGRGPGSQVR